MNYDVVLGLVDNTATGLRNTERNLNKVDRRAKLVKRSLIGIGAALAVVGVIGAGIKGTIDKMDALAKSARTVGVFSEEGFRKFQLGAKVFEEAGISASEFERAMGNLQSRILKGAEGGGALGAIYNKLGDSILGANGQLLETPDIMNQVSKAVADGSLNVSELGTLLGERVGPKVYAAFKLMKEAGLSYEDAMKSVEASTSLFTFGDAAKAEIFNDSMGRLKSTLVKVFDEAILPMLPALADMAEWMAVKLPGAIATTGEMFNEMMAWFQNLSPEIKGVAAALGDMTMWLIEHIPAAINIAVDSLTVIIAAIQDMASWFATTWETMKTDLTAFKTWFVNLWNEIFDFLGAIPARMMEIGGNIVQGLKDGIAAKWNDLKGYMTDLADDMPNWVKRALGIHSPSRVFMGIGVNMMQGLEVGIESQTAALEAQMIAIAEGTATQAETIGDALVNGLDAAFANGEFSFESFKNTFLDSLADMVGQALSQSSALGGMFGGMEAGGGISGLASGLGSSIGDWFAGLFADGGHIGSGKVGIVGEAGPELVKGPANVYSNGDTMKMLGGDSGGGEPVIVNFNINAVDTQTGTEFILKNKNAVVGIINQALNQQGRRGVS